MSEFISPIDRHRHFGDAGRAECAVCCLEAERDRLRAEASGWRKENDRHRSLYINAVKERDHLRTVIWGESKLRASLAGARSARDEAVAERDRLRAVVDALQPLVDAAAACVVGWRFGEMPLWAMNLAHGLRTAGYPVDDVIDQLDRSETTDG